jgi:murein DD-endopeptidase MepM/ murein hydrolase activator NlpD
MNRLKRQIAQAIILIWLLPALACNLPTVPDPEVRKAVEETLVAQEALSARGGESTVLPQLPGPAETPILPTEALPAPAAILPSASVLVGDTYIYVTQPGDTPGALALRFGVTPEQIIELRQVPPDALLASGTLVSIPNVLSETLESALLLPDSEVVYSPASIHFSVEDTIRERGGYLSTYSEVVDNELLTGAQIVARVANETSINPALLLAFLDYRSGWLSGSPAANSNTHYPIGFYADQYGGLYKELILVARQLTIGYYGWRSGKVVEIEFANQSRQRISPLVNAGTAALQYLFSRLYAPAEWRTELYGTGGFLAYYHAQYGDPWRRAAAIGPLLPDDLVQPVIELPFPPNEPWTMTGGPHAAWGVGSPWGGLDFAPASVEKGCAVSFYWTTAAAPGLVVRSERGQVLLDLDGDGYEQTGWVLLYMHVAAKDRVAPGTYVNLDDRIGHPSCEGGVSTGTHVHISRKYNGEWLSAGPPVPFVLSGWQAWPGSRAYSGTLTKGDQIVTARQDGMRTSIIYR